MANLQEGPPNRKVSWGLESVQKFERKVGELIDQLRAMELGADKRSKLDNLDNEIFKAKAQANAMRIRAESADIVGLDIEKINKELSELQQRIIAELEGLAKP